MHNAVTGSKSLFPAGDDKSLGTLPCPIAFSRVPSLLNQPAWYLASLATPMMKAIAEQDSQRGLQPPLLFFSNDIVWLHYGSIWYGNMFTQNLALESLKHLRQRPPHTRSPGLLSRALTITINKKRCIYTSKSRHDTAVISVT